MTAVADRRQRLAQSKLLLVFTPEAVRGEPLDVLDAVIDRVDAIQVRPKTVGDRAAGAAPGASVTSARDAHDWTVRVLDLLERLPSADRPLVFVNDRVDVAHALAERGVDGVHLGDEDMPAAAARETLGPDALIGLSTHTTTDVAAAWDEPIDLVGFGPVFATATKGYGEGARTGAPRVVGPERAWVAAETSPVPLFPIGGIDLSNADDLSRVGRAAVAGAILAADDPAAAATALRELLLQGND